MKTQTFTITHKDDTKTHATIETNYETAPAPVRDQSSGLAYWSIGNHRFPADEVKSIVQTSITGE